MSTKQTILKVHPDDNVLVALTNLLKGEVVVYDKQEYQLQDDIKAKHKFTIVDLQPGDSIIMYGVLVGKAEQSIKRGGLVSTANVKHAASDFTIGERKMDWVIPDVSKYNGRTFNGYHRA